MPSREPLKLAVLLSGGGRTLENIARSIQSDALPASIVCVIASHDKAYGITRAKKLGLPVEIIARKSFDHPQAFSDAVWKTIRASGAQTVCLAGFLSLLHIPDDYLGRVINIHPALLPSFGGHGMFGHHVHQAVIAHGCKITGCTVHFCDNTYDTGPILVQRACPVAENDTPDTLAARVFEEECKAYTHAIRLIAQGRVKIEGRIALIKP